MAKRDSTVDLDLLKWSIREELNREAPRVMAVLRPLKVVITNYPEGQVEQITCENNPENPDAGTREVPFTRELFIEQDDFREDAPRKFFRLKPGGEVRLKHAYFIRCDEVVKDAAGKRDRAALHLRSRIARRRQPRRPQGAGHAAVGVGAARGSRSRCACTTICSGCRSPRRAAPTSWTT